MYGQTTGSQTLSNSGSRMFKIDYTGLLNPAESLATSDKVRRSTQSSVVSYDRMSSEMQRILRMGGKITGVTPMEPTVDSAA